MEVTLPIEVSDEATTFVTSLHPEDAQHQVHRRRPARQGNGMAHSDLFAELALKRAST
jgi:hypothetical protein